MEADACAFVESERLAGTSDARPAGMKPTPAIERFLHAGRIAFVGVSSRPDDFSRVVFRDLVHRGYDVVPVRPDRREIDGRASALRIQEVPRVDAVLVMTPPHATARVVRDCIEAGVSLVWLHRGAGTGSVSEEALALCRESGVEVVPGECPLMFLPGGALIHRVHGALRSLFGGPRDATGK